MRYSEFREARKNPEQNPKVPINQIITRAVNLTTDEVAGTTNRFVSFTAIDKLGINPMSKYDTPLGIYAYPGRYVVQKVGDNKRMETLPFAGNQPYVNLFKAQGNIINIVNIGNAEVVALYKKIAELWAKESGEDWKKSVDQIETYINDAGSRAKFPDIPGGRLWYVTMQVARELLEPHWKTSTPTAWNKLFRMIGVDGVVDTGEGIIHTSEPTQAVFFSTESITDVKRYDNKYSPNKQNLQKEIGSRQDAIAKEFGPAINAATNPNEVISLISGNSDDLINLVRNPKMRAKVIYLKPMLISYVKNIRPIDIAAVFSSKNASSFRTDAIIRANPEVVVKALDLLDDTGVQAVFDIVADEYLEYKSTPELRLALVKRNPSYIKSLPGVTTAMAKFAVSNWKPEYGDIPYDTKKLAGMKVSPQDHPNYQEYSQYIAKKQNEIGQLTGTIDFYKEWLAEKIKEVQSAPEGSVAKDALLNKYKQHAQSEIAPLQQQIAEIQKNISYYQQQLQSFK